MLRQTSLATLRLNDAGEHGGVNVRSSGAAPGMESVKERFRDDAVGGVRLGEESSCKRDGICGQYVMIVGVLLRRKVGYLHRVILLWSNRSGRPRVVEGEVGVRWDESAESAGKNDPGSVRRRSTSERSAGTAGEGGLGDLWDPLTNG